MVGNSWWWCEYSMRHWVWHFLESKKNPLKATLFPRGQTFKWGRSKTNAQGWSIFWLCAETAVVKCPLLIRLIRTYYKYFLLLGKATSVTRRAILLMWNDALEIMPKSASLLQILCEMWKHELDTFDWDGSAFEVEKKVFFLFAIFSVIGLSISFTLNGRLSVSKQRWMK